MSHKKAAWEAFQKEQKKQKAGPIKKGDIVGGRVELPPNKVVLPSGK